MGPFSGSAVVVAVVVDRRQTGDFASNPTVSALTDVRSKFYAEACEVRSGGPYLVYGI